MSKEVTKETAKKWRLIALAIGVALGLSCSFLPSKYQPFCYVASKIVATCGG